MENKFLIKQCTLVPNEGSSLKESFSLLNGNPRINYYESVRCPAISMDLSFIDVDGVVSREGITGGEYVTMEVDFKELGTFKIDTGHGMTINSVSDVNTRSNRQTATFQCISVQSYVNETARVTKRFSGNITDSVTQLLKSDQRGIRTGKNLDSEQAGNKYDFVGNQRRPMDLIQWLCAKAKGGEGYGFLFFETLDGYVFKSMDTLLNQGPSETYKKTEISSNDDFRILEDNVNKNTDIGMSLRMGMYANHTTYFDMVSSKSYEAQFKISEVSKNNPPKAPLGLQDYPSRRMFRVLDIGGYQKDSDLQTLSSNELQRREELAREQNKSYARANLIFSQSLTIQVPCNPNLRAGKVIEVQFAVGEGKSKKLGSDGDNDISGKYLISELRHEIGDNKAYTYLTLIRDTFTA